MQKFSLHPTVSDNGGFFFRFWVAIFFAKSNHPYPVFQVEVGGGQSWSVSGVVGKVYSSL